MNKLPRYKDNPFKEIFCSQVAEYIDWIKCTQENGFESEKTHRNVERKCYDFVKDFSPNCDHEELHNFFGQPKENRKHFFVKPFCT